MMKADLKRLRKQSFFFYQGCIPPKNSKIAGTNNEF